MASALRESPEQRAGKQPLPTSSERVRLELGGMTCASLAYRILDDHVRHCVAGALTSGEAEDALEKTEELLAAVQRFARTR